MKQINDRESDFITHIYPQRDMSDMVIHFFETDGELRLKLSIKSKHDITNIKEFNEITFSKHIPINVEMNERLGLEEYYDYILYFIMNLN